jgi:hypothetical protein
LNDFVDKLRIIELKLAKEQGRFLLFALFLRSDAPDLWDVVVSAPWVEHDSNEALKKISSLLRKRLTDIELLKLSKVAFVERKHPSLVAMQRAVSIEHGNVEIQNSEFFGVQIQHAYIITCRRDDA